MRSFFSNAANNISVKSNLVLISLLNLIDGLIFLVWVNYGYIDEGNEVINNITSSGVVPFLTLKIAVVSLGCLMVYRFKKYLSIKLLTFSIFLFYQSLIIYQIFLLYTFIK